MQVYSLQYVNEGVLSVHRVLYRDTVSVCACKVC